MPHHTESPPRKRARTGSVENGGSMPPLSLSILGVEPLDEFIKEIADWVHYQIQNAPPDVQGKIEVEAKVGILRDRSNQRLMLPILVESILKPDWSEIRFESNMSMQQHKHFNTRLNELKLSSSQPSFPASPLGYSHLHLVDSFYPSDDNKNKIRVTRNEKTGEVVECMRKIRLGDLNVYSPKRAADWRISVSLEVPVTHPIGSATHSRKKDRLSYSHEEFSIDLTQVTSSSSPTGAPELLHELEIEFARPDVLVAAAHRRGDPNLPELERSAFDELIRAFVNNARILVRNAE
ncbi:mRNA-triPase domain-containing protein [Mycena indigotica]|uniref:mRNA-capping enzyme subunit beta n=1 Tax=Mycena indigotica TaxID=2126181 RepID=A0A8H6SI70_9AGAR|nr:mRNA-triPase domain-containing protein [Mycena indigotica]KAF7299126.1 mRNA-triPase domain-containing protein [Mycena indigotica]